MKIYLLGENAQLKPRTTDAMGYVLVPDSVTDETVKSAWSYAVRYSAKGLDVPDYSAAANLLMQRHPSWQCAINGPVSYIFYSGAHAEEDKPD